MLLGGTILVLGLLCLYIVCIWRKPKLMLLYIKPIRTTWYFIFITGSLIFINKNPTSIFDDWQNYFIILVAFFLIDSFVFLNLYFSKLGGHELKEHPETEEAITITQELLNDSKNKVDNLTEVLHYHSFLSYTEDETTYIQKFEELIEEYAILEGLLIDIIPYQTIEERIVIEKGFNQKFKIRRWLSKELTYFHPKENFFLHPIFIHDKKYVIKGFSTSDKRVNETDVQAINLLFIIYSLMVEMVPKEEDSNDKN